ncbi:MAG: hypothetical protein AB2988_04175 [Candidatus Symbiodolus clandestinus]
MTRRTGQLAAEQFGTAAYSVWVNFIMTVRKSTMNLHKLELDRKAELSLAAHA